MMYPFVFTKSIVFCSSLIVIMLLSVHIFKVG